MATKTATYIRRAVDKYNASHKRITLSFTCDIYDRITAAGITTAELRDIVLAELERREAESGHPQE